MAQNAKLEPLALQHSLRKRMPKVKTMMQIYWMNLQQIKGTRTTWRRLIHILKWRKDSLKPGTKKIKMPVSQA